LADYRRFQLQKGFAPAGLSGAGVSGIGASVVSTCRKFYTQDINKLY
jgi:hypothetical protein